MIEVSVVIPVYNAESSLRESLDSVLAQSVSVEVLCVDDGSVDGSFAVLQDYAARHGNVRVFRQRNLGSGPARNLALDHAQGRFVAFMDADDRYPDADALRRLVELADANGCLVAGGYMNLFADGADAAQNRRYTDGWINRNRYPRLGVIDFSEYQSPLGYQRYIFNRQMLDDHRIRFRDLRRFQDPPFCAEALHAARRLAVSDTTVYLYRRGNQVVDWAGNDAIKACHFLDGRLWILKFAREKGYAKLFEMMREDVRQRLPEDVQRLPNVASRYQAIDDYVASLGIKTVAFCFHDFSQGGIQRVMSLLVPQFVHHWYRVVLLTTCDRKHDVYSVDVPVSRVVLGEDNPPETRGARMREAIRRHHIDVVIFQEYYSAKLVGDVMAVRSMGIPYVIHHHNVFSNFYLRLAGGIDERRQYRLFVEAPAMIVLSHADERYFKALGANARYFPNPIVDVPQGFVREAPSKTVLWMARYTDIKRPTDAIRIFKRVLARHPDAQLLMLGELTGPLAQKIREMVSRDGDLARTVRLEGYQADIWKYLSRASALLTTAKFEGFLYTMAEASAAGVPTVGYELPYLELAQGNRGFLQVEQLDVEAAAERICLMIEDRQAWSEASAAARATFERLRDFDQMAAYDRLLQEIVGGQTREALPADMDAMIIRTTVDHANTGIMTLKNRAEQLARDKRSAVAQRDEAKGTVLALEKAAQKLRQELAACRRKEAEVERRSRMAVNKARAEVARLQASESYRVGMFVTWPARRAYRALKCLRENGMKYTLRRLFLGKGRGRA